MSEPRNSETLYTLAAVESLSGNREASITLLRSAIANGWIDYRSLELDPRFGLTRMDAAFQETLAGLVTYVANLRRQQPADTLALTRK